MKSDADVLTLIEQGGAVRKVASTNMNERSSRSHSCFTIKVTVKYIVYSGNAALVKDKRVHVCSYRINSNPMPARLRHIGVRYIEVFPCPALPRQHGEEKHNGSLNQAHNTVGREAQIRSVVTKFVSGFTFVPTACHNVPNV